MTTPRDLNNASTEDRNDWQRLIEQAPTGLVSVSLEGRVMSANRRTCQMLALSQDEMIGRPLADFIHADDRLPFLKAQLAMACGRADGDVRDLRGIKNDDSELCLDQQASLLRDEAGSPESLIYVLHDVTKRKQTERALRESERRFRTLFEQAPFSVQVLGKGGRTLKVNEAWIELWGFERDVVENFILKEYMILEDPQIEELGIGARLREAFAGQSVLIPPAQYDPAKLDKKGRARWVVGHAHPIKDEDDNVVEVVLLHYDVTDRVEVEVELKRAKTAAEAASKMKSTFLATMSHEFRTPLNAILGFTQILQNDAPDPVQLQKILAIIERSGRTLARIVEDMLDLSQIEASALRIEKTRLRPRDVVLEVVTLLEVEARQKGLALSCEFASGVPEWLVTDAQRLKQVLINLIGNALKFTSEGRVTVKLSTRPETEELVLAIHDTGIGIQLEQRERLFKLFSRVDDPNVLARHGAGIGLALSRKLALALGGDVILAESAPGVGSTFALVLPATPCDSYIPVSFHDGTSRDDRARSLDQNA